MNKLISEMILVDGNAELYTRLNLTAKCKFEVNLTLRVAVIMIILLQKTNLCQCIRSRSISNNCQNRLLLTSGTSQSTILPKTTYATTE